MSGKNEMVAERGRVYGNAPITEAVIAIKVQPLAPEQLGALESAAAQLGDAYPEQEGTFRASGSLSLGRVVSHSMQHTRVGVQRGTADGLRRFRFQLDGFSFHRLPPYDRWEEMARDAQRLWQVYHSAVMPSELTRLAVRYINRLRVPKPIESLRDYLNIVPSITLPGSAPAKDFFVQLLIPQPDLGADLLLNEASVAETDEHYDIVLDIDLFKATLVPQDEHEVWLFFEQLRKRKNMIFESCITDKTRELIK